MTPSSNSRSNGLISCNNCGIIPNFTQVSKRGDAREISLSIPKGYETSGWTQQDSRPEGFYCLCGSENPLEVDEDSLGLSDDRIDFVHPLDVDVALLRDELLAIRDDATWSEMEIPATLPRYATLSENLHPDLLAALEQTGRGQFYLHQAQAIDAALCGENVIQATSAGSGKSLGLTLPVLDRLHRDNIEFGANAKSSAILVYPMRALAADQMVALSRLGRHAFDHSRNVMKLWLNDQEEPIIIGKLDSETPSAAKKEIRETARIVITTPDSLHAQILQYSTHNYKDGSSWRGFRKGLRFVVLDEVHVYRGVFGSAAANVFRRLRRIVEKYDERQLQFLMASATIGNPVTHAKLLAGIDAITLVHDDGSASSRKILLVCNPPLRANDRKGASSIDENEEGHSSGDVVPTRVSPQTVAVQFIVDGLLHSEQHAPIRFITFSRTRDGVFRTHRIITNNLKERGARDLAARVASYAATFTAEDKNHEEERLRDGRTLGVVSTNALELGIDIPDLSASILLGYPGQLSSFRQQIGRAGRLGEGVAILIVGDDPLQQHLARDPEALRGLLKAQAEDVVINPFAPAIVERFGCGPADKETGGLSRSDRKYFGEAAIDIWLGQGSPLETKLAFGGEEHFKMKELPLYPELRSMGSDGTFELVTAGGLSEVVGKVDRRTAAKSAFVPAIWNGSKGRQFRVVDFNPNQTKITVVEVEEPGIFTRGVEIINVEVGDDLLAPIEKGLFRLRYAGLKIERYVPSYKFGQASGAESSASCDASWPPETFRSDGLILELNAIQDEEGFSNGAVRAVEHLLLSASPVVAAVDPSDLDATATTSRVIIYDTFGGGIKQSEPLFHRFKEVAQFALDIVEDCPCVSGCPECIWIARRPEGNADLDKSRGAELLRRLVESVELEL